MPIQTTVFAQIMAFADHDELNRCTVARYMPSSESQERKTGAESASWLEKQWWFLPLKGFDRRAKRHLNQVPKSNADFNLGLK
jgi:hypothetical protein